MAADGTADAEDGVAHPERKGTGNGLGAFLGLGGPRVPWCPGPTGRRRGRPGPRFTGTGCACPGLAPGSLGWHGSPARNKEEQVNMLYSAKISVPGNRARAA